MTVSLVTGATGQDGSYLCEMLAAAGAEVHAVVRPLAAGEVDPGLALLARTVPQLVMHEADLADPVALADVVARTAPDEIYNLAGISSVAYSWREPFETGVVSGMAVATMLEAAARLQEAAGKPVRLVQASSAEIFGSALQVPQDESTPVRPITPYGAAKAYAHHMVGVYRARGLHASTVILYNHESPRRPVTFVTRKITQSAARIAAGLDQTVSLGSLDVMRDWGWAPDYMRAAIATVRAPAAGDFVVATGVAHTVRDFVEAAFARVGIEEWESHVRIDPAFVRPAESAVQLGDPTKARVELGWEPSVDFAGVVAAMVDHDVDLVDKG